MCNNASYAIPREAGGLMVRHIFVAAVIVALSAGGGLNAQTKVKKVPMKRTAASNGKQMFDSYCATCHGKDAKGGGPAASALTKKPADLTHISTRNGGTFPDVKVKRYIEGLDEVPAQGSRDMPMWGELFRSMDRQTAEIRVQALNDYLKSLQEK
jgi:mono/diheme cytochrome c family protein